MYPFARLALALGMASRQPRLGLFDPHVSRHICWPWDLDPWRELNNGRTLTLYDLGRTPLAMRSGLVDALRANGWGMTVAGSSVRYRRRVRMFDRVTMVSRLLGWDARFLYLDQSMWSGADCTSQALIRSAVTSAHGIVAPETVARAMEHAGAGPALPGWVVAWAGAEAQRPWPPVAGQVLAR
jgi:acyl-CoA thioesterase FadM